VAWARRFSASERLRELRKETEAQLKEAKALVFERQERAAQRAKN